MVGQSAYAQPMKQKTLQSTLRKYKNNPYINEDDNDYIASSRRNNKLDATQNAPESKFLQQ